MIRQGTHADIPAIIDIGQEVVLKSATDKKPVDIIKAAKVIRQALSHAMMDVFVAEVNGKVVGFIIAALNEQWYSTDQQATDLAFCTRTSHEDQAVWLLRRFLRWAREKNVPVLMALSTGMESVSRTGKLYETHGLTQVGGMYYGSLK